MPCLNGQSQPGIGPLISIGVSGPGKIIPSTNLSATFFNALVDTGASVTCICPAIAKSLNLHPIGKRPMVSALTAAPSNVYLVDLLLNFGNSAFIISTIQVMEFNVQQGAPFQMLMGRDIIGRGILTLSSDNHFSFCI